ncbi:MAG: response regulator transcription factor [Eubacteriales bacterium]
MKKDLVLMIDDDKNICNVVRMYLEKDGYEVETAQDGVQGLKKFEARKPDLILLDIMMPGKDGWEVIREVRAKASVPVIMLSAKGETFDKVLGLELGADDYITKPFEPKELLARVKALLRRTKESQTEDTELNFQDLSINIANYKVVFNGKELEMPPKEIELLYFLALKANRVFTREQLLQQVWGFDFFGDSRTVDVHIKRIREKLFNEDKNWQIKTVWGVGYKFEVN